jgi:hypothetical protein
MTDWTAVEAAIEAAWDERETLNRAIARSARPWTLRSWGSIRVRYAWLNAIPGASGRCTSG